MPFNQPRKSILLLSCFCLTSGFVVADHFVDQDNIEEVEVTGQYIGLQKDTGNAADHLRKAGVDFSSAGGISSLPVMRGLNDDRIKLVIDGAETTSACANHMNPALSYIDASRVEVVDVVAGITPVSMGGDSIAGTINIESELPRYADKVGETLLSGTAAYFYRSNNHNHGLALNGVVATNDVSLTYSGSFDKADSYYDGRGDKVLDTLYRSESHNLTYGKRDQKQSVVIKFNHQEVPYQGFPNQYMDMVGNVSNGINVHYLRDVSWGQWHARVTWQDVDHEMGFFTDEKVGVMPMLTEGQDIGYKLAAEITSNPEHVLRVGHEFHRFTLDDWWPAVPGHMMMGPNDFVNINDGERSRYAVYVESEKQLAERWQFLSGIRYERVEMNTDDVQPYNSMSMGMMMNLDAAAASAFNARSRKRNDDNIDVTALFSFNPSQQTSIEFGYARKTRSPNLYERYSWGRNTMAMTMIGWFGDANGYVGDIDLNPEVAHTIGGAVKWMNATQTMEFTLAPYYTYVDDYIDANQIGSFNPRMAMNVTRPLLQLTNVDAELYGADLTANFQLLANNQHKVNLNTQLAYTRGERRKVDRDLYHIMPLNLKMALTHETGSWLNSVELEWVDNKYKVDAVRLEEETPSYTLLNVSTQYLWNSLTITVGIRNLLDRYYELPLGGEYLSGWLASDRQGQFENLPGEGRSYDIGFKYQF